MRRGFTLMESVVSLGVVGVIAVAIGSSMLLAARAAPRSGDYDSSVQSAAATAERIGADLALAQSIVSYSRFHTEFTIADNTGDGTPETIRYEWSGSKAAPLYRTFNGATSELLASVYDFSLQLNTRSQAEAIEGDPVEGAEEVLWKFVPAAINSNTVSTNTTRRFAQAFGPRVPPDATAYRVTKVLIPVSGLTLTQVFRVDLFAQGADGNPTGSAIGGGIVTNVALVGGSTVLTFPITGSITHSPATPLVCVLRQTAGATASVSIWSPVADPIGVYGYSTDSGVTWTQSTFASLECEVRGCVTRPVARTVTRERAISVNVYVQVGENSTAGVSRSVGLIARPVTAESAPGAPAPQPGVVGTLLDILLKGAL